MSAVAIERAGPMLGDVLKRAADPDEWERFERQLRSTGYCRSPLRMRGRVDAIDRATGEVRTVYSTDREPDETLLKCCGNRREAVCPSCARTYRGDAFQLVASGMRGGKGVPESVAEHPLVFLTLTSPSFGPVHSRRVVDGKARRCRPRRDGERCPHGVSLACTEAHGEDDACLGEPICERCFDYEHAVLWNALAPELWRRTRTQMPRELARLLEVKERELPVLISYVKVAEFQRRGALHFHCILRLDGVDEDGELQAPAPEHGTELLIDAALAAARHVSVLSPAPDDEAFGRLPGFTAGQAREIRWGAQIEVRPLDTDGSAEDAALCAGYIAKYATKSTEAVGGLIYRLEASDLEHLKVRSHVRRYIECAWRLGRLPHLHELRLRRWAHQLGFRGHCFTKSRRYSTTFTALRQARHQHVLQRIHGGERRDPWGRPVSEGASDELGWWEYTGSGYRTPGDAWLAESGRKRAIEQRRIAREELRTGHGVGGESRHEGRR
jgi:hypothetical protein